MSASLGLLGCELFGFARRVDVPLRVTESRPNGRLLEVEAVGAVDLPRVTLGDCCRTPTPPFVDLAIVGGKQVVSWQFRVDTRTGTVLSSLCKTFCSPLVGDRARSFRAAVLSRTTIVAPRAGVAASR